MVKHQDNASVAEWLRSFRKHAVPILSGEVALIIGFYEHRIGHNVSFQILIGVTLVFCFWACYLTWRDKALEIVKLNQNHAEELNKKESEINLAINAKRDKAAESVSQHIVEITKRISILSGVPSINGKPSDETYDVLAGVTGWVIANLNQEGAVLYDDGVRDIHGCTLAAGIPYSPDEIDRLEFIKRLERRITNLKSIKDNIGKYLAV